MSHLIVRNVNDAYQQGVDLVLNHGTKEPSRNGEVVALPYPIMVEYLHPRERVLFDPSRDANPFFHFMEAIWMLAGEKSAVWPVKFNRQMEAYANDKGEYDGAYGYRWRHHFGFDQIHYVVDQLRADPSTRRAVIGMYDPRAEMASSKDVPCNAQIFFRIVRGRLNMTVTNRSNDAVWGAFGANAVHFSMLQEVIAEMVGVPVGTYYQFTNNLHIYTGIPKVVKAVTEMDYCNPYMTHEVEPYALVQNPATFLKDCENFVRDPYIVGNTNPVLYYVARPMYMAWEAYKEGDIGRAIKRCDDIEASDWKLACRRWLQRRQK
jgi:hypothetical protein